MGGMPEGYHDQQLKEAMKSMSGADAIAAERDRQKGFEDWQETHDDIHQSGEMAGAAACYAMLNLDIGDNRLGSAVKQVVRDLWPWDKSWWKPTDPRRNLVKAGALIAAEIDRLDRLNPPTT